MKDLGTSGSDPLDLSRPPSALTETPAPKRQKKERKETQHKLTRSSSQPFGLANFTNPVKQPTKQRQSGTSKASTLSTMRTQAEPVFADMMAGFDTTPSVHTNRSPSASSKDNSHCTPSLVKKSPNHDVVGSKHQQPRNIHASTQPLSVDPSAIDEQLNTEIEQVAQLPLSSQRLASTSVIESTPNATDLSEHPLTSTYSDQISKQIDGFISEAVGDGLGDQLHNIFKSAMLNMSLWIIQHPPAITDTPMLHSLNARILSNEKKFQAANKSLKAALDSYDLKDINLTPKAIEHYQLLDKQEKERQEFLETMVETLCTPKRTGEDIVREVRGMRDEMIVKRDEQDKDLLN